jgi:DNA polymerase-3 subunit delta'
VVFPKPDDPMIAMRSPLATVSSLEEPPGDTLIVLIADRSAWLPATIFSRCQRIAFALPAEEDALRWLDRVQPGANWAAALKEAGGAPLQAVDALKRLNETAAMARDFAAIAGRTASPIAVAGQWAKGSPEFVLNWLGRQVQTCILRVCGGGSNVAAAVLPDSVLQRIDSRNLFCYLDIINRLRGQAAGSFNVQLTLESLLIDWAEGLAHCKRGARDATASLLLRAR